MRIRVAGEDGGGAEALPEPVLQKHGLEPGSSAARSQEERRCAGGRAGPIPGTSPDQDANQDLAQDVAVSRWPLRARA